MRRIGNVREEVREKIRESLLNAVREVLTDASRLASSRYWSVVPCASGKEAALPGLRGTHALGYGGTTTESHGARSRRFDMNLRQNNSC